MISLGYLGESRTLDLDNNTAKLLIVRNPRNGVPNGFSHFPMLSPSLGLLRDAQRWKKNNFTDLEISKLNSLDIEINSEDAWWSLYEPLFEKELRERRDVQRGVEILKNKVNVDREVFLFCYCKELESCHRILVGEYLEAKGLSVNFRKSEKKKKEKEIQINMFQHHE